MFRLLCSFFVLLWVCRISNLSVTSLNSLHFWEQFREKLMLQYVTGHWWHLTIIHERPVWHTWCESNISPSCSTTSPFVDKCLISSLFCRSQICQLNQSPGPRESEMCHSCCIRETACTGWGWVTTQIGHMFIRHKRARNGRWRLYWDSTVCQIRIVSVRAFLR